MATPHLLGATPCKPDDDNGRANDNGHGENEAESLHREAQEDPDHDGDNVTGLRPVLFGRGVRKLPGRPLRLAT